jgi:hypothetical protein
MVYGIIEFRLQAYVEDALLLINVAENWNYATTFQDNLSCGVSKKSVR